MSTDAVINRVLARYDFLKHELSRISGDTPNFIKLSKEFAGLEEFVSIFEQSKKNKEELEDCRRMLQESHDDDFVALINQEISTLESKIAQLDKQLKLLMIPKDATDEKNAIVEIRAGTGGDEAGLFAGDLLRMYQKYSEHKRWKFELLHIHETGIGSVKEAVASIAGKGVFSYLKFESGVHRVQRVPITESSGRVHTSTATVAVLPEAEDVDVKIEDTDLKIDVMRASGAGGQHVNKTESAVRITHIPTGIVVTQQDERSQHMNRMKAMKILRAKLYELEREKLHNARSSDRRSQIGSGDRSERIRTYNYPQGRVTDHRINLTLYKLPQIMEGAGLEEVIDSLIQCDQEEKLANFQGDED